MDKFKNYKSYINEQIIEESKIEDYKTVKYVVLLKLRYPSIKDFDEFNDSMELRDDVEDVIRKHNERNNKKDNSKLFLLEMKGLCIVLGIEINENYTKENIPKFLGNYFSRPLYREKGWDKVTAKKNTLFKVEQVEEYRG